MTKPKATFHTELDAAKHLLKESSETLTAHGVNFAVVGGWSAYLFHSSKYGHPGTFDVDILLHEESLDDGTFDNAAEALLQSGYLRAPKNVFQAHRILKISGENLVFHIDFLNEREPGNAIELVGGKGRMKSIYTEAMKAVFAYGNYRSHPDFPSAKFPSPETFIATKAAAAMVKKRKRDAFDIFVTVQDQKPEALKESWEALCRRDGLFSDANDALIEAVSEGNAVEKIQDVLNDMQKAALLAVSMPNGAEIYNAFNFLVRA